MVEKSKSFVAAARKIAKGDPPQWLVPGLEHFSEHYISKPKLPDEPDDVKVLKQMLDAVQHAVERLEEQLPVYRLISEAPYNIPYPVCIDDALTNLHEVTEFLEGEIAEIPRRAGGPRPDLRRPICAAVCAEAYRMLHGQIEPYSQHLQDGCEDYWKACGNPPTGKSGWRRNWEEYLLRVAGQDNEWIRGHFGSHT
jgi:hypothetical protein